MKSARSYASIQRASPVPTEDQALKLHQVVGHAALGVVPGQRALQLPRRRPPQFAVARVADNVTALGQNFTKKVLGNLPVAPVSRDLIGAGRADNLGNVRVRMQALQLIAVRGKRIKKRGLFKKASRAKIPILLGDRRQVDQNFVHAAVLIAQHALALINAESPHELRRPTSHALRDLHGIRVAGVDIHVKQTGHNLVVGVEGRPYRLALREVFKQVLWIGTQVVVSTLCLASQKAGHQLIAARLQV